jgi:hypothetical protein
MKTIKIWSMMVLMTMALPMMAQDITESDLEGIWVRYESNGEFRPYKPNCGYSLQDPESVKFYLDNNTLNDDSLGVAYVLNPKYSTYDEWGSFAGYVERLEIRGIQDYFISKGDILHIQYHGGHYCQRYKILSYDGTYITLETMSGKGTVTWMRETTDVSAPVYYNDNNEKYYSLDGKLIPGEPQKGIFIKGKKKMVKG